MKKTKKILIAIPSFTFGGAENHGFVIAKVLRTMGYTPIMFSFSTRTDAIPMYKAEGIEYMTYSQPIQLQDVWSRKIYKALRFCLFLRKHTIYSVVSTTFNENMNFGLVWKWAGLKTMYWHQFGVNTAAVTKFEKYIIRTKPIYVCNSAWVKQTFVEHYSLHTQASNIHVIHNAVFERPVQENREQWRTKLGIVPHAIVLTMTANFFPEKDYETLLHAFSIVRTKKSDIPLYMILAGNAPGASPEKLRIKALAFDLQLQHDVKFIDATPDVFGIYAASDVGVLSTLSEGFSNSLLEYMWCGLPIVATDIPPNKEALPLESHTYLFTPKHAEECAEKLNMLIENAQLRKDIGSMHKAHARTHYTIQQLEEKYRKVFIQNK